jgi:beta-glucosidase
VRGLTCHYFAERGFGGAPYRVQVERQIGKLVSTTSFAELGAGIGALRWTGWLWPKRDGRHELSLRGPGSVRLELAGKTLIDDSTPGREDPMDVAGTKVMRRIAAVDLVAGQGYPVVIEYVRPAETGHLAWEYLGVGLRQPRGSVAEAAALAGTCDGAIVVIGAASLTEAEGYDRESLDLPGDQNALVEAVLAANPKTIIVLVGGAPYAMPWINHTPAVVVAWLGGEEGPDATARILFGEASPSGRLPVTFPTRLEDTPAHGWYPGGAEVTYGEGLFVGYRHYDRAREPPLFPFGHGLTYSRVAYENLVVPETAIAGESVTASFTLRNVGDRQAKETAQLYVRPRGPSVERPVKELKGFVKVSLEPGESRRVALTLDARAFAFWDPQASAWNAEPGAYDILVAASAADIELQATVRLEAATV